MAGYKSPHLRLHGNPNMKSQGAPQGVKARHSEEGKGGHPAGEHVEAEPHGEGHAPEHVTKTHPGETEAHPKTGVHAVHVHHVGGGSAGGHKFTTHTHLKDGSVQTDHHPDETAMRDHMEQQFPTSEGDDLQHDQNADNDTFAGGGSAANMMSSLGGE